MNRAYHFVLPDQLPRPDGSIGPDAVGIPGVTMRTSRIRAALLGTQIGEAEFIEGVYAPSEEDRAPLQGENHRLRLEGIAMDGEKWLARIDRAARLRASKTHPGLDEVPRVGDRWHYAHNVKKPFKAQITRDRKKLPRGKKGEAERTLLKNFYHYLVHASWHDLVNNPEALAGVTTLLERFPQWREPFWVVKHFLYLQEAADLATATERLAAWDERLTPRMRTVFKDALNYIGYDWEAFLAYFKIKERTGLSVTSSPVESRHKKKNGYWYNARRSGPKLLKAKSAADAGIAIQLERQKLGKLWREERKREKRQREATPNAIESTKDDESARPPLAA